MNSPESSIRQLWIQAEAGKTEAQYQFGICLWEGIGISSNRESALEWITLAAGHGHAPAQAWLGSLYLSWHEDEQARFWFEKAALQGDPRAMYYLSLIYIQGNVFGADPMLAFEWLKKSAENGFTEAMGRLGIMYCLGHGTGKDHQTAMQWFQKAALKGDHNAQMLLATAYLTGSGVPQDETSAIYWFDQVRQTCADNKAFLIMADTILEGTLMPSCRVSSYILLSIYNTFFPETKVDMSTLIGTMSDEQLTQAKYIVKNILMDNRDSYHLLQ